MRLAGELEVRGLSGAGRRRVGFDVVTELYREYFASLDFETYTLQMDLQLHNCTRRYLTQLKKQLSF